jgi:mycothiol synthase
MRGRGVGSQIPTTGAAAGRPESTCALPPVPLASVAVTGLLHRRPFRPDDAARWAALLAAAEEVDRRDEHYDADDCAEELADPELDLDRDTLLVLDGDGPDAAAVAYQVLHAKGDHLFAEGVVHPAHRGRGLGSALLALARTRAAAAGVPLRVQVAESGADAVGLARDLGLEPVRWWSELGCGLTGPVVAAPLPAGLDAVPLGPPYDAARWDGPLRDAHNAAFADHWGSVPVTAEGWAHRRTGTRAFRPACSVAALHGTEVVGYVLAYEFDADTARTGRRDLYVATVGTLREWRGRGVAGALLSRVLAAARAAGFATSSLTVDAANPTGALGVYRRAGYALRRREITFASPS